MKNVFYSLARHISIFSAISILLLSTSYANTGAELNAKVDEALRIFHSEVSGAEVFMQQAAGYLVFPRVIKAGFVFGGEIGEGALRVDDQSVGYYLSLIHI